MAVPTDFGILESQLVQHGFVKRPLTDRDVATGAAIQASKVSGVVKTIQHNGTLVASEGAVDLEDVVSSKGIPFTVSDDSANSRVKVSMTVARNTGTLTFTASATSANLTVAHGLGVTPTTILAQAKGGIAFCFIQIVSADGTNIVFSGHDTGGTARTGTNDFYWLAIP